MTDIEFPFSAPAIRIDQCLGTFYAVVLPSELLLHVAESDQIRAKTRPDGSGYDLDGTQRFIKDSRLEEIADYINRVDSSFPNSIILAANYDSNIGFDRDESEYINSDDEGISTDKSKAWFVKKSGKEHYTLNHPD